MIWVGFICIILMMPQFSPGGLGVSVANALNYAGIAVAIVIGFAAIYWLVSARKWFKGPVVQGSAEELKAIERDLASGSEPKDALSARLDRLYQSASELQLPSKYASMQYTLRMHLDLVRDRIAARAAGT